MTDVVGLAQALIRFPSVTPEAGAALEYAAQFLEGLGFICRPMPFGHGTERVENLYARWGRADRQWLFCGHLDVVPPGDLSDWTHPPFEGVIADGLLYGRGAVDMKGNVAAWFAALAETLPSLDPARCGLAVLLTADEEGKAEYGVRAVMPALVADGEGWLGCLTGEPTSQARLGDAFKPGRRGSLSGRLVVTGRQGHTGYPGRADNAAHKLIAATCALRDLPLDQGDDMFEPSWLAVTSIDIGNPAGNVIPGRGEARFNVRFNTRQTSDGLKARVREALERVIMPESFALDWQPVSEPYYCPPGAMVDALTRAIEAVCGLKPAPSTVGGTSDSRFIHPCCPVVDFGLPGQGMHEVDERIAVVELQRLQRIYATFLTGLGRLSGTGFGGE